MITLASTTVISFAELLDISRDLAQLNLGYLGVAVTVLVILAGAFVYFNLNPIKESLLKQEEKIDDLKEKADGLLRITVEKVESTLQVFKENQHRQLLEFLKTNSEQATLNVRNIVASSEKAMMEKIEIISENKDTKLREIISSETDVKIRASDKSLTLETVKLKTDLTGEIQKLKTSISSVEDKILEIKHTLVEFEIENYLKKNQIGAVSKMIDKLNMDIEKGWGEDATLLEIKEYISRAGMPSCYLERLYEVLEKTGKQFLALKIEIQELANKKMYKA